LGQLAAPASSQEKRREERSARQMNFISSVLNPAQRTSLGHSGLGSSGSLSGTETREDGKVVVGYHLLRGKRPNMEDFHHAQFKKDQRGQQIGLFGIFDGHGGPYAADFVRANLFVNLMQSGKFPADIYGAIKEAFETTDQQYLKQDAQANRDDGCTGVTAFIIGTKLYVANVGDSRAVLCRGGKAQPLSVDHKPNSKEERQRIENAGGVVVWAGTWRVGGVLAVSRAFGDKPLKRYVIATPDIREESLRDDDEFLILASDGLWDVISNQDAAGIVRNIHDPQRAAARLAEEALQRGSNDNISCIVIRFRLRGPPPAGSYNRSSRQ